jgi:hypothetical protein
MDAAHSENFSNPFSLKIQLSELYSNPLIDQFFSILLNSIEGKDFLILVIGESHNGKTTFLYKLISQIEQNIKPCKIKVGESHDPESNDNYYPAFFYETENNQVIILDDAHNLNSQELSMVLKNDWDSCKKTRQFVLFCEPRINKTISAILKKMPKKASVNKLYIPSFDKEQTLSYIKHYLRLADYSGKFPFSEKNIKNIYENSKGLPGKINKEAYRKISDKNSFASNTKGFNPIAVVAVTAFIFFIIGDFAISKKSSHTPVANSNIPVSEGILKNKEMPYQKQITKPDPIIIKPKIMKTAMENKIASLPSIFQEQWIMQQNPQEYTIQIMAAKGKDVIDNFLKLNINTPGEIAYYKMYSKGDVWYKIISGKYKTLAKARTACNNLPEKLKNSGPWPRHFASIHNDINKFIKINKKT